MMEPRRCIALVSQVWVGHIPAYHRSYARAFARQGIDVMEVIFRDEPAAGSGLARKIAGKVRALAGRVPGLRNRTSLREWRRVAQVVAQLERERGRRIDGVFFVYLDLHFLSPAVPGSAIDQVMTHPWSGIVVHPQAAYGARQPFPAGEGVLQAAGCRAVAVIDRSFVAAAQATWPGKKVVLVPDLTDTTPPDPARPVVAEIRAWAGGARLVGLVGAISAKKNVAGFVALARAAQAAGENVRFVIAGLLSEQTTRADDLRAHREILGELPPNCRAWTAGLEEGAEFNAVVSLCDAIFVAYLPAPENSNVLTKAAYFRKPVLASEGHLMADSVRAYNLGEVISPIDAGAALPALRRVLAAADGRRFAEYYECHAEERLADAVTELTAALAP